jgi:hypothetical protein
MNTTRGLGLAISFVLLLPATLAWGQTCCTLPTAEVADPGSKLQVGSSGVYRMLGSPSGQGARGCFRGPVQGPAGERVQCLLPLGPVAPVLLRQHVLHLGNQHDHLRDSRSAVHLRHAGDG